MRSRAVTTRAGKASQGTVPRYLSITTVALLASCLAVWCQEEPEPSIAPLNPAFVKYMKDHNAGRTAATVGEGGFGFGFIPSPVDDSHLTCDTESRELPNFFFPASFDLRTQGKVSAVRNQSACGTCWAFSAMACLESALLPAEAWDFSENNLKDTHGFDWTCCYGGNDDMSIAYFARWDGPANESDDPYNAGSCASPPSVTVQKHLQDVDYVPIRTSPTDNDAMKSAIESHAVSISMRWEGDQWNPTAYWNPSAYAYNYNGTDVTNHLVAVVGWDDNFPKSSFSTPPTGNGAWLIKNSWGTGWGDGGYFWLSYYDTHGGRTHRSSAFYAAPPYNYSAVYQVDPLGRIGTFGYGEGNPCWGANMFVAEVSESLSAVSTYFNAPDSTYELYVYTGCAANEPRSGTLAASKTGSIGTPGYHPIVLDSPVALTGGQLFSIVFKLTTPGFGYPLAIEYPILGYSSAASAGLGQSFYGFNGIAWSDLTSWQANTNACIKGFAAPCSLPGAPSITSIEDIDPCTLTGIRVTFTPGFSATRHDLYKDGSLAASAIASPLIYHPGDISSHNYAVRAVNIRDSCSANSNQMAGMDAVCPPDEAAPGYMWSTAQLWSSKTAQLWPSLYNANAYRLYRGVPAELPNLHTIQTNSCLRWDGAQTSVSGLTEVPSAGSFYWYIVVGYNQAGEGPAGASRTPNSSGGCP